MTSDLLSTRKFQVACAFSSLLVFAACQATDQRATPLGYPTTARVAVVDSLHGVEVADPFRWLEDDVRSSSSVADWVGAQNKVTFGYLEALPKRAKIKQRLTELWDYERVGTPQKHGEYYYFWRNDGLQPQAVLYAASAPADQGTVILDPNSWSKEGTRAFAGGEYSPDGRYLAYGISDAGSDWSTWQVLDLVKGAEVGGRLSWIKFSGASWLPDNTGFYYSRYEQPKEGEAFQAANRNQKVYFHRVGTNQGEDRLVYERPDQPDWSLAPVVSDDGRYLIVHVWDSGTPNLVHLFDLQQPGKKPLELVDKWEGAYNFIANSGTSLYFFVLGADSPKGSVVTIPADALDRSKWKTLITEGVDALEDVKWIGGRFVVLSMHDAASRVSVYSTNGAKEREVTLPGLGSADGIERNPKSSETFFRFVSIATPPSIYRYDVESGETDLLRRAEVDFNPADYTVTQEFYNSKDGTRVPIFIAHKKGLELNGKNPTLLYAYGGFNISMTPNFSPANLAWMEAGGVFAEPNLRGGGEYGEAWHLAGTKTQKQNVFDDFIAAAEHLISRGYTQSSSIAILGSSNGGLLVGAVMCQRPELFGCCLPAVGVMDMLRFHQFTAGRFWVYDYGSVDVAEEFAALRAYSPYHNLKNGTCYPPTLVTTADTDDRVVPGHSFKFAARLQEAQGCANPVLIRIETSAGHGAGKPTAKRIEEAADQFTFAAKALGFDW